MMQDLISFAREMMIRSESIFFSRIGMAVRFLIRLGLFPRGTAADAERLSIASNSVPQLGTDADEALSGQLPYLKCLKFIHRRLKPEFYLEIGVYSGSSLMLARCAAVGVDPAPHIRSAFGKPITIVRTTSDEFFDRDAKNVLHSKPDFVFIDGMHLFECALRDFMHAEEVSAPHGLIVVDDIFPNHPAQATRERHTVAWTGDVWKLHATLKQFRPDLYLLALDTWPTGLLVIAGLDPMNRVLSANYDTILASYDQDVGPPQEVLDRRGATAPSRDTLDRLIGLLMQLRNSTLSHDQFMSQLRPIRGQHAGYTLAAP